MARFFVAVNLPADVKRALVSIQPLGITGVKVTKLEQMHVTVHFLGDMNRGELVVALRAVKCEPFQLELRGVGEFTSRDGGAILWAGIEVPVELRAMHTGVAAALASTGFRPETRPYSPHVTLARCKPGYDRRAVQDFLARNAAFAVPAFEVEEIVLYSSVLAEGGPVYRREAAVRLEG